MSTSDRNSRLWAGAAALAAVVCGLGLIPALYFFGLSLVSHKPNPPADAESPDLVVAAVWVQLGGTGPARLRKVTPLSFLKYEICLATASRPEEFQLCRQNHAAGALPAGMVARAHVVDQGSGLAWWKQELAQAATAAWITRNWTIRQVTARIVKNASFGSIAKDLEDVAHLCFDRTVAELEPQEVALLVSFLSASHDENPLCDSRRTLERRNDLLRRMAEGGSIPAEALPRLLDTPVGVLPRALIGCSDSETR